MNKTPRNHKLTCFLASIKLINPLKRIDLFYILNQEPNSSTNYIGMLTKNGYLKIKDHHYYLTKKSDLFLNSLKFELIHTKKKGYHFPVHNLALIKGLYNTLLNSDLNEVVAVKKEKSANNNLTPDLTIQTKEITYYFEIDTGTQRPKAIQFKIDRYKNTILTNEQNKLIFFTKSTNNYNEFKEKYQDVYFYYLDQKEFNFNFKLLSMYYHKTEDQKQKSQASIDQAQLAYEIKHLLD
jgi:hypothetical protein